MLQGLYTQALRIATSYFASSASFMQAHIFFLLYPSTPFIPPECRSHSMTRSALRCGSSSPSQQSSFIALYRSSFEHFWAVDVPCTHLSPRYALVPAGSSPLFQRFVSSDRSMLPTAGAAESARTPRNTLARTLGFLRTAPKNAMMTTQHISR